MRLIDADKLDFSIVRYLGEFCHVPISDIVRGWKKIVDAQPTAYDVDKVVERLEVNSMFAQADDEPFVMLDDAVEIVKSGGVDVGGVKH